MVIAIDEDDGEDEQDAQEGRELGAGVRGGVPEGLDVVAEEADEHDGEHDEEPVLPELEGAVPVVDHVVGEDEVEALVEHVARADVVYALGDEELAPRVGAGQVVPAVLLALRHAGAGVGQDLAHVGRAQGPGAGVACGGVPAVERAQGRLGRVHVQAAEVEPEGAGAGQGEGRAALPPLERLCLSGDGQARALVLQAVERGLARPEEQAKDQRQKRHPWLDPGLAGLALV